MNESLRKQLNDIKAALRKLPATGEIGFEGLIAVTLTAITGIPFRLASSGRQFGVDAKAAYESDSICLEGKRYERDIPRSEVLSKIAELSMSTKGEIDLWVLGATCPVTSQLADDVRQLGAHNGITTLILDWSGVDLPSLGVALSMADTTAANFLDNHLEERKIAAPARKALKAIRDDIAFSAHSTRIRSELSEPAMGIAIARRANTKWLTSVFSDKQRARLFLGQPLSPRAPGGPTLTRSTLVGKMKPFMTSTSTVGVVAVLGDEGSGKSWLVAQTWLLLEEKPVMIVLTPDDFPPVPRTDVREILVRKLAEQTGDHLSEAVVDKWRRRLRRWSDDDPVGTVRLVILVDGMNQRPNIDWARLMDALASEIVTIGGRLIVSVRTLFFRDQVKPRVVASVVEVEVPEWTEPERDTVLEKHGIKGSELHAPVAMSLKNPRLLGIALELLEDSQIKDFDELSVSRLLFEHMRVGERDSPSPLPAYKFARNLEDHANEILSRVTAQQRDDLKVFDGGLEAVSDGRFFIPLAGDPTRYTLAEDGLTLALGFSVLARLQSARRDGRDLDATLGVVIEPISALDRSTEVIIAALTVACMDDARHQAEIGSAIVRAFAEMQNPNADDLDAFTALARRRPEVFMQAAHSLCLAGGRQPNFDWIEEALQTAKDDDRAWSSMSNGLQSWLTHYSRSPERGTFSRPTRKPEEVEKTRQRLKQKLDSLSPDEVESAG